MRADELAETLRDLRKTIVVTCHAASEEAAAMRAGFLAQVDAVLHNLEAGGDAEDCARAEMLVGAAACFIGGWQARQRLQ